MGLVISAASVQAAGSDQKLEQGFPFAFAMRGCTQEDAPALEIHLTRVSFNGNGKPSPPYIHIEISSLPSETIGQAPLKLAPLRRDPAMPGRIARAELVEAPQKSVWLSGTVTINQAVPGGRVSGNYEFMMPGGATLSQSFTAEYSNRPAVCG
jgi:hypothetical protein